LLSRGSFGFLGIFFCARRGEASEDDVKIGEAGALGKGRTTASRGKKEKTVKFTEKTDKALRLERFLDD